MVFFKKVISSVILELNKNLHITDLLIIFSLLWVYLQISVIDLCGQMGAFVSCCLSVQQNPCMLCSTVGLNFHLKCTTVHKFQILFPLWNEWDSDVNPLHVVQVAFLPLN